MTTFKEGDYVVFKKPYPNWLDMELIKEYESHSPMQVVYNQKYKKLAVMRNEINYVSANSGIFELALMFDYEYV